MQVRGTLLHPLPDVAGAEPILALLLACTLAAVLVTVLRPAPDSVGRWLAKGVALTEYPAARQTAVARQPADVCPNPGVEQHALLTPPLRTTAHTSEATTTPLRAPGLGLGPGTGPSPRPPTFPRPLRDAAAPAGPPAPPG